jgi:hypothetical protein
MSNLFATPTISELKINLLLRLLHARKLWDFYFILEYHKIIILKYHRIVVLEYHKIVIRSELQIKL